MHVYSLLAWTQTFLLFNWKNISTKISNYVVSGFSTVCAKFICVSAHHYFKSLLTIFVFWGPSNNLAAWQAAARWHHHHHQPSVLREWLPVCITRERV